MVKVEQCLTSRSGFRWGSTWSGWWLNPTPLKNYEFVNWDVIIPTIGIYIYIYLFIYWFTCIIWTSKKCSRPSISSGRKCWSLTDWPVMLDPVCDDSLNGNVTRWWTVPSLHRSAARNGTQCSCPQLHGFNGESHQPPDAKVCHLLEEPTSKRLDNYGFVQHSQAAVKSINWK